MASEDDAALREAARNRGYRLVKSRRRKPGGDFGLYGLHELKSDAPVFGVGEDGLTASAEEVQTFLRHAVESTWRTSAEQGAKAATKTAPPPQRRASRPTKPPMREERRRARPTPRRPAQPSSPSPPQPPKPRVDVVNLLTNLPAARDAEAFTELLQRPGIRVERIVSRGQSTPEDAPMVQAHDEWVLVLQGEAKLRIEDAAPVPLGPGDHLLIAGGQRHWVTWTTGDRATVWLAVHFEGS